MEKRGDVNPDYTPDLSAATAADRAPIRLTGARGRAAKAAELAAQDVVAKGAAVFKKAQDARAD